MIGVMSSSRDLFRIDPTSGAHTELTSGTSYYLALTLDRSDRYVVTYYDAGLYGLASVDPETGSHQTIVANLHAVFPSMGEPTVIAAGDDPQRALANLYPVRASG